MAQEEQELAELLEVEEREGTEMSRDSSPSEECKYGS